MVRELAAGTLTREDLEIARRSTAASFLRTNEMKEARTRTLLFFEARGLGFDYAERFPAELAAVGLDEMNAFLKAVLSTDRAVEVVIGPEPEIPETPGSRADGDMAAADIFLDPEGLHQIQEPVDPLGGTGQIDGDVGPG